MTEPPIRVGIVSWNTAGLLDACLHALPAALAGVAAEVVVVDNASADDSAAVAEGHDVVVVRNAENVGYARAMNQALRHGSCDATVLIALNPDTEPPPGSLTTLVHRLLDDPGVGLVLPRLVGASGTEQHSAYRFPSLAVALGVAFLPAAVLRRGLGQRLWLEGFSDHGREVDVDWGIGAVHVIRAAAIGDAPAYDERWFMYAEDLERCWQLHRSGWRIRLVGSVTVPHVGNAAGSQAWGDAQPLRWLVPTYQWFADARGDRAVRAWATANAVGLLWLRAKWRGLARLSPRRFGHLRGWAADAARPLAIHWRVARGGVDTLDGLLADPPD